jgi:formate dehydrogenase iron-sulfur subunit
MIAAWSEDRARELAEELADQPGALLPVLHRLHVEFGCIPPGAVGVVADVLNLSRAEVHGVVTFYRDFNTTAPGEHVVRVCRAEACQAVGGEALAARIASQLGVEIRHSSADGRVSLEEVFCLGNCALGPSIMVDGRVYGRAERVDLDAVLDAPGIASHDHAPAVGAFDVFVSCDTSARAVGADEVATEILREAESRGLAVRVVRTGSRGMLWLEPLVEVGTSAGRIAYGPVHPNDVASLFEAGFLAGGAHPLGHGATEALPFLAAQRRVTFARVGIVDPASIEDYEQHGGWRGLRRALTLTPWDVCDALVESGIRGRGGAGFPAGVKWRAVLEAPSSERFVCCNADEGDSGTFADRMLMEGDPFSLIEGMAIAAHTVAARQGYIYVRSEYPDAARAMRAAVDTARAHGFLGEDALGPGRAFDIDVRDGAGSYVCGEETAMLESLEGKRGVVRAKPPLPALVGLFGKPTVVNNVLTLATVPAILADGAPEYAALGHGRSRGTQVFQLAGDVARGGIVELPFGVTVRELVEELGGGTRSGRPVRAVQIGGPLGAYHPQADLDLPMDYEELHAAGGLLGHGGLVVFDDTVDLARQARQAFAFCAEESCGKCTPCRVGAVRGVELMDRVIAGDDVDSHIELLHELCELMADASLCPMGGLTPVPVRSALRHFGEDFVGQSDNVDVEGDDR